MKCQCKIIRGFCLSRPWALNLSVGLSALLFLLTIWIAIEYQRDILHWLHENFLVHGALFAILCATNLFMMSGLFCLGMTECEPEESHDAHTYKGRRSSKAVFPELTTWVDRLGQKGRDRS